jgi:hypothetical protein
VTDRTVVLAGEDPTGLVGKPFHGVRHHLLEHGSGQLEHLMLMLPAGMGSPIRADDLGR